MNARLFPPTRAEATARLAAFLPHAGKTYAKLRNHDPGPDAPSHVSRLSPYVRHRVLTEAELVRAAVDRHGEGPAEKFIQEVFWRTYWKGWLELRPGVWDAYCEDRDTARIEVAGDSYLAEHLARAEEARTGIDCFDHWVRELVETGYLHNHARMWFASIWIFTLKLPWELGADFFLRHLLDGDPASNTLSWRWVGGLQTRGKTYLARADNIAAHTGERFNPQGKLAQEALPLDGPLPPLPRPIVPGPRLGKDGGRTGLLVFDDDVDVQDLSDRVAPVAVAGVSSAALRSDVSVSGQVQDFVAAVLDDSLSRFSVPGARLRDQVMTPHGVDEAVRDWARDHALDRVVARHVPVGPGRAVADRIARALQPDGVAFLQEMRGYDARAWPLATKGFFPFRKQIRELTAALGASG
ncbi:FAD-binding domain-containing protein [Stappia sp. ES.058]|uniref:FAD-binding domain-containing protein n=1 Tax=Stappia sp. ES.058 TaxID=1881061 RepID=UPI000879D4F0|nr:FAD-binding domain-containing protein [Stappia sp. ES.058]SDT89418.1 deoxyribodipyrimidine photo-lyase [Stappia sp. ES.058]